MSLLHKGEVEKTFSSGEAAPDSRSKILSPHIQCVLSEISLALLKTSLTEANKQRLQMAQKMLREDSYDGIPTRVRDALKEAGINVNDFHADA